MFMSGSRLFAILQMSTEKALNNPATARRAHAKRQTNNDRRKALPT